jgi:hypothetical protein
MTKNKANCRSGRCGVFEIEILTPNSFTRSDHIATYLSLTELADADPLILHVVLNSSTGSASFYMTVLWKTYQQNSIREVSETCIAQVEGD